MKNIITIIYSRGFDTEFLSLGENVIGACRLTLLRHWYLLLTECGRIRVQAEKNVKKNSGKTVFNEAPWFAAVYRKDKKDKPYVCSGTIVSPFLIVSGKKLAYIDLFSFM